MTVFLFVLFYHFFGVFVVFFYIFRRFAVITFEKIPIMIFIFALAHIRICQQFCREIRFQLAEFRIGKRSTARITFGIYTLNSLLGKISDVIQHLVVIRNCRKQVCPYDRIPINVGVFAYLFPLDYSLFVCRKAFAFFGICMEPTHFRTNPDNDIIRYFQVFRRIFR